MFVSKIPVLLGSALPKHLQGFRFSLQYADHMNKSYCIFNRIQQYTSPLFFSTGNGQIGIWVQLQQLAVLLITLGPYFLHAVLYFYLLCKHKCLFVVLCQCEDIVASSNVLCYYHFFRMCHHILLLSSF